MLRKFSAKLDHEYSLIQGKTCFIPKAPYPRGTILTSWMQVYFLPALGVTSAENEFPCKKRKNKLSIQMFTEFSCTPTARGITRLYKGPLILK